MKHLDLFSGIGGFSLGMEATERIKTVAFCEIDSFCTKVLNKNWPTVPVYNDIKELTYERLKADGIDSIDIITGGYPCQPFSVAGRKKGEKDPRHLWPEMFRLIKECRPTFAIGENVAGHIKQGLDTVLDNLESEGYAVRTFSISASSIGANHKRERIWIVAYSERNYNFQKEQRVDGEKKEVSREHREKDSTTWKPSGTNSVWKTNNGDVANTSSIESYVGEDIQHTSTGNRQGQTGRESGTVANTDSSTRCSSESRRTDREISTESERLRGGKSERKTRKESGSGSENVANSDSERGCSWETDRQDAKDVGQSSRSEEASGWWDLEPKLGRVAYGIPDRTHRLKSLGNSVVPHIPYFLAKSIIEVMDA